MKSWPDCPGPCKDFHYTGLMVILAPYTEDRLPLSQPMPSPLFGDLADALRRCHEHAEHAIRDPGRER